MSSWGIPEKTHSLETEGRIVEYTRKLEGEIVCTTRITIDESSKIAKYWYRWNYMQGTKGRLGLRVGSQGAFLLLLRFML